MEAVKAIPASEPAGEVLPTELDELDTVKLQKIEADIANAILAHENAVLRKRAFINYASKRYALDPQRDALMGDGKIVRKG